MSHQLPMPAVPGKVAGIISTDPWQQQCGVCGLVDTKPDDKGVAIWIILSGFQFCLDTPGVRHCRDCLRDHARGCHRYGCQEVLR